MPSDSSQIHSSVYIPDEFPHGGNIEVVAKAWHCNVAEILDLSTSLHPAGLPQWLGAWLERNVSWVTHYPDAEGEPARSKLAEYLGVAPEQVLITAGAQAIIEIIFQAMAWKSLVIRVPCYNEPIRCARRAGCKVHVMTLGDPIPQTDALWWTSPSNPFGDEAVFPQAYSGVLDESYMPFLERKTLGLSDNVIRLGSLTKAFCIPGLRLGYVLAEEDVIVRLKTWLPPWPSSTLALHLLAELLPEAENRDKHVSHTHQRLTTLLEHSRWEVHPSQASFVLARPSRRMPDFAGSKILVRLFPEWPQLQGWIRFGLPHHELDWERLGSVILEE